MRPIRILATAALVESVAFVTAAAPAGASLRPRIDVGGPGTYALDQSGVAEIGGTSTGRPFDVPYTARLAADDGTLPAPGECEPATVTVLIDGPRRRHVELESAGTVCGQRPQPPYVVTQVYTGLYEVKEAMPRRLQGTDGFVELRLASEGRANLIAIDT